MTKDSLFLALDLASPVVSLALDETRVDPTGTATTRRETLAIPLGSSSSSLLPAIQDLFDALKREPPELTGIVCTAGPGSFTGLRIGMATARGLADSLRVPATAVPSLWLQAWWATRESHDHPVPRFLLSALPAHAGCWFVQRHRLAPRVMADGGITLMGAGHLSKEGPWIGPESLHAALPLGAILSVSPPLADLLCDLALSSPPDTAHKHGAPSDQALEVLLRWNLDSLGLPIYAQTPAVATRPRASTSAK